MKNTIIFFVFVFLVVGVLYLASGKKYSSIPDDIVHKGVISDSACMECHGQGKINALKTSHPPKFECFKCHKPASVQGK